MEHCINNFHIYVLDNYDKMSEKAAEVLTAQIKAKNDSVIGFATGSTPIGMYKALIEMNKAGKTDFSKITTFNLDEYYPIQKSNPQSYDYFMREYLFNHININSGNINIPNGEAQDYKIECEDYEKKISAAGGIDIQILGIGLNGHIGFNEPDRVFPKFTHLTGLDPVTIDANAKFFDSKDEIPRQALTMGIRTIMHSKKILLLVNGAKKAEIIHKTIFGDITPKVPASILQLHRDVVVVLDAEAAEKIKS